jgi:hypothetical protein
VEEIRILDTPWDLELMEGCLRAVSDFVVRHQQDDPAKEEVTVPVASGELRLVLSWVVEDVVWDVGGAAFTCHSFQFESLVYRCRGEYGPVPFLRSPP